MPWQSMSIGPAERRIRISVRGIEPDEMKAPRSNLVVKLAPDLITTSEFFRDAGVPEVVHVKANHATPVDATLQGQGIEKRDLTFPAARIIRIPPCPPSSSLILLATALAAL
ncbi:MAG: hypothetical protein L0387_31970 [Acidobacteria bacterium]|nr:hypothetical protein [Acidobacteriota bacterium]MCI0723730.1 hypothetical protein [Acidobacteriota bacterium]